MSPARAILAPAGLSVTLRWAAARPSTRVTKSR